MRGHRIQATQRSITPSEVLASIQDDHRLQSKWIPELDPDAVLSFETTVCAWRDACHLVGWRRLGRALNEDYRINLSDSDWYAVLEPARRRTLREVCEAIAAHGSIEVIEPVNVFGVHCMTAGAFNAVRRVLEDSGIAADDIAPSSPLRPVLRSNVGVLRRLSRIAPGRLPDVTIRVNPVAETVQTMFVVALLLTFAGVVCNAHALTILAGIPALLSAVLLPIANRLPLADVRVGTLNDFRDLSYALVGAVPPPRRRASSDQASGR